MNEHVITKYVVELRKACNVLGIGIMSRKENATGTIRTYIYRINNVGLTSQTYEGIRERLSKLTGYISVEFIVDPRFKYVEISVNEDIGSSIDPDKIYSAHYASNYTASRFKFLREYHGIKLVELEKEIGLSTGYISDLLNGKKTLTGQLRLRFLAGYWKLTNNRTKKT